MGLQNYLSTLAAALLGQGQSQSSTPVPQQPQGSPSPAAAPSSQSGGLLQGASSFLGNPLTQAALGGYFNAIGSPRLAGLGGRIKAGGLGALGAYDQAIQAQQEQAKTALETQKEQQALLEAQRKQTAIGQLPTDVQPYVQAGVPELAKTATEKAGNLQYNSAVSGPAFLQAHPKDQLAAVVANSFMKDDSAIHTIKDYEDAYQAQKEGPLKTQETEASIAEKKAQTERLKNAPASGMTANWYDPKTKKYYRGAQRSPNDVPASVASRDTDLRTRAAWEKAYNDAKTKYITERTTTGVFGGKTPPTEADVDAYARAQADAIYGPLSSIGATSGTASADEPSTAAEDPLSLIPEGATPGVLDGVHGYRTPDGAFHSVE